MIRKLAPYTKGYRVWIFLGVLCSAGEAVLELLLPKAMSHSRWTMIRKNHKRKSI